jgi:cysteine sulfinate desulfinase/cysteine desulfurase-like protein
MYANNETGLSSACEEISDVAKKAWRIIFL